MKERDMFHYGYKGKGMCDHCENRSDLPNDRGVYICAHYRSACKLVSRNCPGIPKPIVRNKPWKKIVVKEVNEVTGKGLVAVVNLKENDWPTDGPIPFDRGDAFFMNGKKYLIAEVEGVRKNGNVAESFGIVLIKPIEKAQ